MILKVPLASGVTQLLILLSPLRLNMGKERESDMIRHQDPIMYGAGAATQTGTGMIVLGGSSAGGSEIGDSEQSEHSESRAIRNIPAVRGRPNLQVERTLFHIAMQVVSHKCRMFLAPVTSYCRAELLRRDACTKGMLYQLAVCRLRRNVSSKFKIRLDLHNGSVH